MLISDLFPVGLLGHCVLSPRLCSAGTSQSAACSSGSPDKWHLTLTYLDLLTAYSSCCCYYCYECDCDCDCYCYCYYHYGNNDDDYDDESDCSRKGKLTGNDLTIELFLKPCPAGTDPSGASVEIPACGGYKRSSRYMRSSKSCASVKPTTEDRPMQPRSL